MEIADGRDITRYAESAKGAASRASVPLLSYIGDDCSMNNANETRAEFNHLIAVAKDTGCASYKDLKRETPMSYTEAKKAFDRIRDMCDVKEYSAHDFRDTCATEWRESGISIDMIARLLGHQKTEVTEQRYVKYRPELYKQAKEKMNVYGTRNGTKADG